jgi:late competence protein required for DNA uptake (superfamily II DNA/RNA helicase)
MNAQQLQTKLDWTNKRMKFAWAKYYEQTNIALTLAHENLMRVLKVADDKEIPQHIKTELTEMATELKKKWECPVCIDMIENNNLEITNCGHYYCKDCLQSWKQVCKDRGDNKWKCGMCNRTHKFDE